MMKVTIRQRWEEIPITEYPVVIAIWLIVVFVAGFVLGSL